VSATSFPVRGSNTVMVIRPSTDTPPPDIHLPQLYRSGCVQKTALSRVRLFGGCHQADRTCEYQDLRFANEHAAAF
jgi:hypothetical protein